MFYLYITKGLLINITKEAGSCHLSNIGVQCSCSTMFELYRLLCLFVELKFTLKALHSQGYEHSIPIF